MRIAQVAPPIERDDLFRSWHKIVWWLSEELVGRGHEVTFIERLDREDWDLFAALDRSQVRKKTRLSGVHPTGPLAGVARSGRRFDVIHYHGEDEVFLPSRFQSAPVMATVHYGGVSQEVENLSLTNGSLPPVVSPLGQPSQWLLGYPNWWGKIPYGVPHDWIELSEGGAHLVYAGPLRKSAGVERAIQMAHLAGRPLVVVGPPTKEELPYFQDVVRPHVDGVSVIFAEATTEEELHQIFGDALAVLVPCGESASPILLVLEALACGTPVVGHRSDALSEVIVEGETGYLVEDLTEAAAAIWGVRNLHRAACRAHLERRFSMRTMTDRYVDTYCRLLVGATGRSRLA